MRGHAFGGTPIWHLVCAAVLAAAVLSSAEFIHILLTSGPFWVRPALFLRIFPLYAAAVLIALGFLYSLMQLIPPMRKYFSDSIRRFRFFFVLAWIGSGALLIALVTRDLDPDRQSLYLLLITLLIGVAATLAAWKLIRRADTIPVRSLALAAALILLIGIIHWLSDRRFTAQLMQRNERYRGTVSHLCLTVMDAGRGDYYSCYGYPFRTTPNVDRMASEGLRCHNAFSASNWTPPGHISIFTGTYPPRHANDGLALMPDELHSLTEILRDQGYYCVALYNNTLAGRFINLTQGFDRECGVFLHAWPYPAPYRLWGKVLNHDHGASSTFPMAADLFKWIQARGGHLFLYINAMEPHGPYNIHEPFFSEFTRTLNIADVGNLPQVCRLCSKSRATTHDSASFTGFTDASYRYLRAVYASELAYLDRYIGMFLDELEEAGLLDETLYILTSDHGEFLGEHFTVGHPELLFNPVLRIPLILRYPRLIEPRVVDNLTSNADILPTVLALMGLEGLTPGNVDGIDIMKGVPRNRVLMSLRIREEGWAGCLIDGRHKLFLNKDDELLYRRFPCERLLFNLDENPEELLDRQPTDEDLRDTLTTRLQEWVAAILVRPGKKPEVDPETIKKLKSLGYI